MSESTTTTTTAAKEAAMNHTTTVTKHEDGTATLDCTCGEHVTYSLYQFTVVEARRHEDWHAKVGR